METHRQVGIASLAQPEIQRTVRQCGQILGPRLRTEQLFELPDQLQRPLVVGLFQQEVAEQVVGILRDPLGGDRGAVFRPPRGADPGHADFAGTAGQQQDGGGERRRTQPVPYVHSSTSFRLPDAPPQAW